MKSNKNRIDQSPDDIVDITIPPIDLAHRFERFSSSLKTALKDSRHKKQLVVDTRGQSQHDRDRLIHSNALRRLANVTQVVDPLEGQIYHNRLTHTLKVAQVGRRLAERVSLLQPHESAALGGVDPEVVESAALAHDLGHPPFGHVSEVELNNLVIEAGNLDGYEGNAQSFRIVTRLEMRSPAHQGLNLTRATLNAILKYPYLHQISGLGNEKWGAYSSEKEIFEWARKGIDKKRYNQKTVEAELMDWADDIAFSVHDTEDFYRAGLIPLESLADRRGKPSDESSRFLKGTFERWKQKNKSLKYKEDQYITAFNRLLQWFPKETFHGTQEQRATIRNMSSHFINQYVSSLTLTLDNEDACVSISPRAYQEVTMLKELTWHYVIHNPSVATQQHGKTQVIKELFEIYMKALKSSNWVTILPASSRGAIQNMGAFKKNLAARIVADIISNMSDMEALAVHRRLVGIYPGSINDKLHR